MIDGVQNECMFFRRDANSASVSRFLLIFSLFPVNYWTLSSNDADGIENVKKQLRFYKKNNHFARASRFFVHFFARFCTTMT